MEIKQLLLLGYTAFLVIYLVVSIFPIYNLWQFGYKGDLSRVAIIVYILVSLSVISLSFVFIILNQF